VTRAAVRLWGVQVAAGFNRDQALAMYARAMSGLSAVFGNQDDPSLLPLLARSRGTSAFYQVRIGTDTRREAGDLCSRIRRAGGACLVKRNMGTRGLSGPSRSVRHRLKVQKRSQLGDERGPP
jgi:hypothetical protein